MNDGTLQRSTIFGTELSKPSPMRGIFSVTSYRKHTMHSNNVS